MRTSGAGKGGKTYEQRQLSAELRDLTIAESIKHLKKGKGKFYQALLLRLAPAALPRITEVTGKDGEDLFPNPIYAGKSKQ